jgi:hypothetical protein
LVAQQGINTLNAAALLPAAGDNPQRLRSEDSFAHLYGVAPLDASSGKQQRHRLNRGGDRQANCALHSIVVVRMSHQTRRLTDIGASKDRIADHERYGEPSGDTERRPPCWMTVPLDACLRVRTAETTSTTNILAHGAVHLARWHVCSALMNSPSVLPVSHHCQGLSRRSVPANAYTACEAIRGP